MSDEKKVHVDAYDRAAPEHKVPAGPKLTRVTLKQNHRHGDVAYTAGDEIEVNEADAQWLRDNKVI